MRYRPQEVDWQQAWAWLSAEEIAEAGRFVVAERREAFVYYRATARLCLASYLNTSPADIPLQRLPTGKPVWAVPLGGVRLAFNTTHRRQLGLLAVTSLSTVGIDLECLDAAANIDAIAAQALSSCELAEFQRLEPMARPAALLRAWTRKEAYLKALGVGLARPLPQIEVTFSEEIAPQIRTTGDPLDDPKRWALASWSPQEGWFAAVAAPREAAPLQMESFDATSLWIARTSLSIRGSVAG
jgi:4'-phosphopantetheinyl transferase